MLLLSHHAYLCVHVHGGLQLSLHQKGAGERAKETDTERERKRNRQRLIETERERDKMILPFLTMLFILPYM